jgi:hypothetical protein
MKPENIGEPRWGGIERGCYDLDIGDKTLEITLQEVILIRKYKDPRSIYLSLADLMCLEDDWIQFTDRLEKELKGVKDE